MYASKNHFLAMFVEKGERRVHFARGRAFFDVELGMLRAMTDLGSVKKEKIHPPLSNR